MEKTNLLNVFIASPGDVPEERLIVREVCSELNQSKLISVHSLTFRVVGWEDQFPSPGRPQEIINKLVKECDIFVCIFHKRFGTPSGKEGSGTLEEFLLAYDSWKSVKKPHILFYFKDTGNINSIEEIEEVKKIFELKGKIKKENLLLFGLFDTPDGFRSKFRKHMEGWIAENAASKYIPKAPTQRVPAVLQIPNIYKNWLIDQCQELDIQKLVDTRDSEVLPSIKMPQIFIPLYTDNPDKKKPGRDEEREKLEELKPVDIEDLVAEKDYLLVRGQAGSGKTTLIKHLAYKIAKNENAGGLEGRLPIWVVLNEMQKIFKDIDGALPGTPLAKRTLGLYLKDKGCGLDMKTAMLFIKAGKALFLIDGLDEVDDDFRKIIVLSLAELGKHNKMVFSGRPHGMDDTVIGKFGDKLVDINNLIGPQIQMFVENWFKYDKKLERDGKSPQMLMDEMRLLEEGHRDFRRLIDTPLMLTAVCILYHYDKKLPDQRVELYEKFINNLIHKRFDSPQKVWNFLSALAFAVHESSDWRGERERKRGFDRAFALKIMKETYARQKDETDAEYRTRLDEKFNQIEQNCGVLKIEGRQYLFWHLSFQEFLAARNIQATKTLYDKAIQDYWDRDWYHEVIKLFIGYLSYTNNNAWANKIVKDSLKIEDNTPFVRWRLAAQSLMDIHEDNRDVEVAEMAREKLLSIFENEEAPKVKADAGEILGWLGDTRDLEEFVGIPGGKYNLENIGEVDLEIFEIGRYPVTNLWYEKFVKADGYKEEKYWAPNGWKWLERNNYEYPRHWHERQWKCPNSPVVSVVWYEADAFCRWLTVSMEDGYNYRLPTEQEWQAAAAGKERRKFPWGEWDEGRCNYKGSGIEKTSPVGIFPKGNTHDYGLVDMGGNVDEWTCTDYDSKEEREDFTPNKRGPILKGGAWCDEKKYAGCAARSRFIPGVRSNNGGFRCARTKITL